jgi:hypothetical protein
VTDFSVLALAGGVCLAGTGMVLGTAAYLSPSRPGVAGGCPFGPVWAWLVVVGAAHRQPAQRYQRAIDLQADLGRGLAGAPAGRERAGPTTTPAAASTPSATRPRPTATSVLSQLGYQERWPT